MRSLVGLVVALGLSAACARPAAVAPSNVVAPSANRAAPSANRAAPSANRVAPSANRAAPSSGVAPPSNRVAVQPVEIGELRVDGFEPATVSFPSASRGKMPLLVVAHGAGDTPEALCRAFRDILGDRGVILCPSGPRRFSYAEGRYFPDHPTLEKIVLASVAALAQAYPEFVDGTNATYAGYSQGGMMGALMIPAHGDLFPRLILVEGGAAEWSPDSAALYRKNGGRRVLFACGRQKCQSDARETARRLARAGLETRVVLGSGGHTFLKGVGDAVRAAFDWVVRDDPRWSSSVLPEQAPERDHAEPTIRDAAQEPR